MASKSRTEAVTTLHTTPQEELFSLCCEAHKDFYGFKGRYMHDWSVEELVGWFLAHFQWEVDHWGWKPEWVEKFKQEEQELDDMIAGYELDQLREQPLVPMPSEEEMALDMYHDELERGRRH